MTSVKTRWTSRLLCVAAAAVAVGAVTRPVQAAGTMSQDEKMKWFREAKFGLFIHWGLYAVPAGTWKGQPIAGQVLLDRCSGNGDNIWHVATGGRQAGPIVLLNCTFRGSGHVEGHQRWTTGMLLDNCRVPEGGIDFKNRGSMGSGHGWGVAWAVAWNCMAKSYVVQQPPGAFNWMIGCKGENVPTPRPFDSSPTLPLGISDSPGGPVVPQSLYLAQLAERLGPRAVKNIGY